MGHFCISFQAREGSSALINRLSQHPDITVPLFEQLDWMHLKGKIAQPTTQQLATVLDHVFRFGQFDDSYFDRLPDGGEEARTSVGFKWRLWHIDDVTTAVFLNHKVTLFALERLDIIDNCVGGHASELISQQLSAFSETVHIQFTLKKNKEQSTALKSLYDEQRITADLERVKALMNLLVRQKILTLKQLTLMQAMGVPVYFITYEDFLAKPDDLLERMQQRIDVPMRQLPPSDFVKVNTIPLHERVLNWSDVINDPTVKEGVATWNTLMDAYQKSFKSL